ncbi:hypothetical protein G3I36_03775, partial [Streptomyces sp. SID10362]|nr:hypothetical protein [Streptomyces sp. SID10362]
MSTEPEPASKDATDAVDTGPETPGTAEASAPGAAGSAEVSAPDAGPETAAEPDAAADAGAASEVRPDEPAG